MYGNPSVPNPGGMYPMSNLRGVSSAYAPPLRFNQSTELVGGYDAPIDSMTGQEVPQTNFAGGGLASLVASKGRGGDSMLVHMNPEEVKGLQALALAHGGTLTINPETGLVEANFLKKLLPAIAGFALNALAPGVGTAIGSALGIGGTAAGTVGTALLVGGTTALIEGDLKKGLMAGLGAYSGASLQSGLKAAAAPAPVRPPAEEMTKLNEAIKAAEQTVGSTPEAVTQAMPSDGLNYYKSANVFKGTPTAADLSAGRIGNLANQGISGLTAYGQGVKNLFTSPESRTAFGEALGGGFKSPLAQTASKYAVLTGAMDALTPEEEMPDFTSPEDEFMYYTPGAYNPRYGQGWNQPLFLPGTYSRKYRPPGMAGGGAVAFASGGAAFVNRDGEVMVDPASLYPEGRPTAGLASLAAPAPTAAAPAPKATPVPVYTSTDPQQRRADVLNYIGELNKAITVPYRPSVKPLTDPGSGGGGIPPGGGGGGEGGRPPGWPPNLPWPPGSPGGGGGIKYPAYDSGFRPPAYEERDGFLNDTAGAGPSTPPFTFDYSQIKFPDLSGIESRLASIESRPVPEFDYSRIPSYTPPDLSGIESRLASIESRPTPTFDYSRIPSYTPPDLSGLESRLGGLESRLSSFSAPQVNFDPVLSRIADLESRFSSINPYSYSPQTYAVGDDFNFGFAGGGMTTEYMAGGKFLTGDGDGMSDDIKANINGTQEARLADGEFVIPADVVSHLGNGSSNAGAKKLYAMMDRIREARTGDKEQAPAVKTDRLLPA